MRKISLAHLSMLDADPLALIDAAAYAQIDAVGLRIIARDADDPIVPVAENPKMAQRIKRRLRDAGVAIHDIEAVWLRPDFDAAALQPAVETAADLGARYLLALGFDPVRERLVDNFGQLCALAATFGLHVALEFMPYSALADLQSAHDALRAAAAPNARLMVDSLHLSRSGGRPADLAAYDPALFPYVQISDAPAIAPDPARLVTESRHARLYPGEGELPLGAFLRAFAPHVPVAIEAPNLRYAHLAPRRRAHLAAEATRRLLAEVDAYAGSPAESRAAMLSQPS